MSNPLLDQAKQKVDAEAVTLRAKAKAFLAAHKKALVILAVIVVAVLAANFFFGSSAKPAAGATAPHASYSRFAQRWTDYRPFDQGGAQGNG